MRGMLIKVLNGRMRGVHVSINDGLASDASSDDYFLVECIPLCISCIDYSIN